MLRVSGILVAVLIFSAAGGVIKVLGSYFYGSKALLVDALTSIANFVVAYATVRYYLISRLPPDEDHHYGHYKLGFGGALVSLIAYSFVAGVVVMELKDLAPYVVDIRSTYFAVAGFATYLVAILVARRGGTYFLAYSTFTITELIESSVVIVASYAGATLSYLIDYLGAVALTTFIAYELLSTGRDLLRDLSDVAPPEEFMSRVRSVISELGFEATEVKVRKISADLWHGDLKLRPKEVGNVSELIGRVEELKRKLSKELNLEVTVELMGLSEGSRRPSR